MIAKNKNSVSPLVVVTNDGKKFEISGELIKGGYFGYKDSLVLVKGDELIELTDKQKELYALQIMKEFEEEGVSTKLEIS